MASWTASDVPDQTGRVAIVTGANAGIGFETALVLAEKGAHVVLACRSETRGADALRRIEAANPAGSAELMRLDLADLDSVRAFADAFRAAHDRLDLLVNNAGVMMPPASTTAQGWELQWGVNVLGRFALTGLLLDRLDAAPEARVVTLSSIAHRMGRVDFGNLRGEKPYADQREYAQSKLGDLVFARELQRRLAATGSGTVSIAAHPGVTHTELQRHSGFWDRFAALFAMDPPQGVLPTLFAATAPAAEPGGYYGPDGVFEIRGHPAPATVSKRARDRQTAEQLWRSAEAATDVRYLSEPVAA